MSHQTVASVLIDTLTVAGWMDDADELISDMLVDLGILKTTFHVRELQTAMEFVRDNGNDDHPRHPYYGDLDRLSEILEEAIFAFDGSC